jgi:hypothetical protein
LAGPGPERLDDQMSEITLHLSAAEATTLAAALVQVTFVLESLVGSRARGLSHRADAEAVVDTPAAGVLDDLRAIEALRTRLATLGFAA